MSHDGGTPAPAARHIVHVFPTFAVGGSQRRLSVLATHLGDRFRHTVVALDGVTAAQHLFDPSVALTVRALALPKRRTVANILRARRILRELAPHRVVTYNWGAIEFAAAARTLGARRLHCEDGFGPEERDAPLPRRALMRRVVLGGAAHVVVPSHGLARIATTVWGLSAARVVHLPNGIDTTLFRPTTRDPEPGQPLHVGTIASLRPEKNLERLLAAAAPLVHDGHIRLTIVGDGPARPALERGAARHGLAPAAVLVGASATPERVVGDFDVFALSSDTEQMPLSVLEAMAAGLPIVATDVGDLRTMIATENLPYLVPRDAAALTAALRRLIDDPAGRAAIGRANRAKALAAFDLATMVARWGALLD